MSYPLTGSRRSYCRASAILARADEVVPIDTGHWEVARRKTLKLSGTICNLCLRPLIRQNGRVLGRNGRRRAAFSAHTGFALAAAVDSQRWRHTSPWLVAGLLAYPLRATNTCGTTERAAFRCFRWRRADLLWTIPTGPAFGSLSLPTVSRDGKAAVLIYQERDSNFSDVYISEPIGVPTASLPRFARLFA
jgi:hypothetical protein